MKKVKRYNGEGDSAVEMDPEEEANKSAVAPSIEKSEELATPAYKSFKEAFAAERKAGSKTFEYMGKKYTTDLAPQTKAAKPTAPIPKPALRAETNDDRAKRFVEKRAAARAEAAAADKSPKGQDRILTGITKNAGENKFMGGTKMASGGMTSPASKRADGIAQRGKTRGKMC